MKKPKRWLFVSVSAAFLLVGIFYVVKIYGFNLQHPIGKEIDNLNGVAVYYNGPVSNVSGRHLTADGYNLGLKYQCVEFVKRYYYEHYQHKMPNSYGHAKDFFDGQIQDGQFNTQRALYQYTNPSQSKPMPGDLLIFDGHPSNIYGHVAIISNVAENEIEIIQQNPGKQGKSRKRIPLLQQSDKWQIDNGRILGWLRKKEKEPP
ncbi:MAG: CHAP domain-containing protein [Azoarcus sp.]|jgi:surface antigen|nr:CHAP domain-containing protein [Azoarcus sp.]